MPELPEVETMRRGLDPILGSEIIEVQQPPCTRRPILIEPTIDEINHRLCGKTLLRTGRAGKRVVLWCSSDEALVFEPRMTGLVLLVDPPTTEHLRLRICLKRCESKQLLYWDRRGLGQIRLLTSKQFAEKYAPDKLGPDALTATAQQLSDRLGRSTRIIKVALLDQRAVAGIGNLYASEILHLAGVHPQRRCNRMTQLQWQAVATATRHVLSEAIRYEGSTLSDGTYRNALNQDGGYQNMHRVYDKAGRICPRCQVGKIQRTVDAQRSTFFCPKCQTRRGAIMVESLPN